VSYDFRVSRCPLAADTDQVSVTESLKELVAVIEHHMPNLRRFEKTSPFSNSSVGVNLAEYIELTDSISGLQIILFPHSISVTIPYRAESAVHKRLLDELWNCLKVFEALNFSVFDLQQGKTLRLDSDFDLTLHCYSAACERIKVALRTSNEAGSGSPGVSNRGPDGGP